MIKTHGALSSSDDLDNKQIGVYTVNKKTRGTPINSPEDNNFVYLGIGSETSWGIQLVFTNTTMYFRYYTTSNISNWNKVVTTE